MKYAMKIKQVIVALLGNCVLGAGLAMCAQTLLGSDPCVSFSQAASIKLGITLGQMITITNVVLLVVIFILKKENLGIATLIVVFLNQYPIDFFTSLITYTDNLFINILWILAGIVLIGVGCNLLIASNLGMGIYDAFIYSIVSKVNKSYVFCRYIIDGVFLLLTILLKGYIGIGTVLSYLLTGNLLKLTKPFIDRIINFK